MSARQDRQKRRPIWMALLSLLLLAFVGVGVYFLANAWQSTRLHEGYLPQLEEMARRSPYDGRLLALLAGRQIEAAEYAAAADDLRRAIAAGENNEDTWQNLGAAVAAGGNARLALTDLQIGLHSLSVAPRLFAAQDRVRALGPNPASAALAAAISPQGPRSLIARYGAGSFLNPVAEWWGRHHPESSGYSTCLAWVTRQPRDAEAQRLWGEALFRNRRYNEAEAALERSLTLSPNSPATHLALAELFAGTGWAAKASLQYLDCLRLRPDWPRAMLGFARVASDSGQDHLALQAYARASQIAPQSADAWSGLGQAYLMTGATYDKSVAAYDKAAALAPRRTDFFDDYADALRLNFQWAKAETIIKTRLAAAPDDAYGHYLLGKLLMEGNPTPDSQAVAESETREAVRLTPNSPLAQMQLGQILLTKGDTQGAITALTNSLRDDPYNQNALLLLSKAFGRAHQPTLADEISHQAAALYRDQQQITVLAGEEPTQFTNISLHQELADLYARTGRGQKATREANLVQLLKSDPTAAVQTQKSLDAALQEVFHGQ